MSQWNNNNKHSQNLNQWANSNLNGQYQNQHDTNYQNPPSNQYVSFNEFINQIQHTGSNLVVKSNQNSQPYSPIMQNDSTNFMGVPSSSTSFPQSGGGYQNNFTADNPNQAQKETALLMNSLVLKSKLTPTATEFVPKSAQLPKEENKPVKSQRSNNTKNSKNNYNDEINWRNRPSSSSTNQNESSNSSNIYKNQESNDKQYSSDDRGQNHESSKYQKSRGKNKDAAGAKTFYNSSVEPQEIKEPRSSEGRSDRVENGKQKSWAGSQRLRAADRNNVDDEQFASSYNQYNSEKYEKSNRATNGPSSQFRDEQPERSSSSRFQTDSDIYNQNKDERTDRSGRLSNVSKGYSSRAHNESDTYSQNREARSGTGRAYSGSKCYNRDDRPEKFRTQGETDSCSQNREERAERSGSGRVYKESKGYSQYRDDKPGTSRTRDEPDTYSKNREERSGSGRAYNGSKGYNRDDRPEKLRTHCKTDSCSQNREERAEGSGSGRVYNESKGYSQYRDDKPGTSRTRVEPDTYSKNRDERSGSGRAYNGSKGYNRDDRPEKLRTQGETDSCSQNREERAEGSGSGRVYNESKGYSHYRDDRPEKSDEPDSYSKNREARSGSSRAHSGSKAYSQNRDDRPDKQRTKNESNSYRQNRDDRQEISSSGRVHNGASPAKHNSKQTFIKSEVSKELTQRERLTEQLDKGTLECLVCCERVKQVDTVWSCSNCYHVLHLRCIRKWAMSSMQEGKWRCPACQNTSDCVPAEYRCMCGAAKSPEWSRGAWGAHTCGAACARARACVHPCTLRCHPGPCPPCQATVLKKCGCGAETRSVVCSSKLPQECGRTCGRLLDCKKHRCERSCHESPCDPCAQTITQECYCPARAARPARCARDTCGRWACGGTCARVLACGRHVCRRTCHAPPCEPCHLLPDRVATCPCGKTKLEADSRKSCSDPIPVCSNICAKPLSCGPAGDRHFCRQDCHTGPCPDCPDKTVLNCRCGHSMQEVACSELPQMIDNVFCKKKCNKKLSCGRHRCRTLCCADETHRCGVVCGRTLTCQRHKCEQLCHTGHCAPCPVLSFEELSCACGATVRLPPVACGARAPACARACGVARACAHEALHACHPGPCPPCVVLTARACHGDHEERKTIPCSQGEFSCGMPCGKPLACGKHKCIKVCHKGPCDTEICRQPCTELRPSCGHECCAPCHVSSGAPCPSPAPCRRAVRATCACGRRHHDVPCHDHAQHQARILSALAATKMQDGETVDVSEATRPAMNLKTLECDDECRVEQRTRQMALALQIRNPDVSAKLAPRYSDFIRQWASKDPALCKQIHDQLTHLVQLAKKSKQKTRSHSFPSMNWQKRQLIHELCEHFGCESVAYDAEPNRNVVATAHKETSWLPAMSITEVLSREAGKRRVPGPVLRPPSTAAAVPERPSTSATTKASTSGWATLTSTNAWAARSQHKPTSSAEPVLPKIDYFDNPPE